MVLMSFTEFSQNEQEFLLDIARLSIEHWLSGCEYEPDLPAEFLRLGGDAATFVTLKTQTGMLRGCIGTLKAVEPLYLSIAHNAVSAAFRDPRFPALTGNEWSILRLSISVLSESSAMDISSEDELKQQLRPGIDGLILEEQGCSATFLPSVWDELSGKEEFLHHLKLKAGLPANYWSNTIHFSSYQSTRFSGPAVVAC